MDIQTLYSKTEQLWKLARISKEELYEELCYKKLRHKESGVIGDFYDLDFRYTDSYPVRIIIMDEDGGKYRGILEDFEVLR